MRIIHTSDIHIDSPLNSKFKGDKTRERRRELLSGFARLAGEAKALSANAVIIAGDLFDSRRVSNKAIDTALEVIDSAKPIKFFYLEGNHEADALRKFGREIPDNLFFFEKNWTYFRADDVVIAGRSELTPSMFESLCFPAETKNILVMHGELRDKCDENSVGIRDAKDRNIDYLAMGHYHSYSETKIDQRGVAVYSGTPEGRGFDETGDKGYVVVDIDHSGVHYSFRSFAKRILHIIPLDLTGIVRFTDIVEKASEMLSDIPGEDIVRLELSGGYCPELWKDTEALYRKFGEAFYHFEIKDSSKMAINPEDYKYDKSLKGEFIRTVSSAEELTEAQKERVIACGIAALMGEELFED